MGLIQSAGIIKDVGSVEPSLYGGAGFVTPRYKSANWYLAKTLSDQPAAVTLASVVGQIRWHPFIVDQPLTISAMGLNVTTLIAASNARFAIYASDTNGNPTGSPLFQSTSLSTAAVGAIVYTVSYTFAPGFYWIAQASDTAGVVFTGFAANSLMLAQIFGAVSSSTYVGNATFAVEQTGQTYGTFPTGTITLAVFFTNSGSCPIPHFKVA